MKTTFTILILALTGFFKIESATITITNQGTTFSPDNVVVKSGDIINFVLASIHDAVQVDKATWDANGNTPMTGGFSVPLGGGSITLTTPGTYYYVCQPHASIGMKGTIVVESSTSVKNTSSDVLTLNVYPNPATNYINVELNLQQGKNLNLDLIDITGKKIISFLNEKIDGNFSNVFTLPNLPNGKYFLNFQFDNQVIIKSIIIKK